MNKSLPTITLILSLLLSLTAHSEPLWKQAESSSVSSLGEPDINTISCLLMQLDIESMRALLISAPDEDDRKREVVVSLPFPDGSFRRFSVYKVPVIHPELQNKYPGIYTFAGQGVEDPSAVVRLDITMKGFHAMVLSSVGAVFIDPYNRTTMDVYKVYEKSAAVRSGQYTACGFDPSSPENKVRADQIRSDIQLNRGSVSALRSNGSVLKTYRTAIACTGEYATFHGGTVPGALSAIVTSLNRVSGVFELELAVRLTLVANNDTVIFLNATSDPYSNNNGGTMLGQNQQTMNSYIGFSNYDLGHVFSTGGGGIAGLGVVCNANSKGRGVTGSPSPVGDPFDIDYVAHEMGHQFGGNHTFNSNTGSCGGNGNSSTAYEPGSGTTIMAYAGICSPQNTQNYSDPYFHTASFDEIIDYITLSTGANCPVTTNTGNTPPVITSTGGDHVIPLQTPFMLEGSASDADGDSLTYCWEQFDLGPSGSPSAPTGNAPCFRSFNPSASPLRYFPRIQSIVANANSLGEVLPSYAREMHFRLTVRDNRNNGGGVTYEDIPVTIEAVNTGSPFQVTAPNTSITWTGGASANVTWNVAGTDVAPVNSTSVDIYLSTDGGFTYPVQVASGVPNSGQAVITVPSVNTNKARIMVRGAGNVFFDISNVNFTITTPVGGPEAPATLTVNVYPNPSEGEAVISIAGTISEDVAVKLIDLSGRQIWLTEFRMNSNGMTIPLPVEQLPDGVYVVTVSAGAGVYRDKLVINR